MNGIGYTALAGLLFLLAGVPAASANVINQSSDPYFATQFFFYCGPYTSSFEPNKHYIANNGQCTYSVPATLSGNKQLLLLKGVPGVGATTVGGDTENYPGTLMSQYPNIFGTPAVNDKYFAVIYEVSLDQGPTPLIDYLLGVTSTMPAGAVLGQNFYLLPWQWGPKPVEDFEPVVVVPGILGSWEKDGVWLMDPVLHTYDNLLDTLRANGYVDGQTLFPFPYDWEQTNIDTAYQLGQKIQEIKTACGCGKVDVIAHSMGGLAAEYYIAGDGYQHDIDQLVLLAVPQAGAPLAYKAWEGGEFDFGKIAYNALAQIKFYLEARKNGYSSIFDYIQGKPILSVQELMPIYSYLRTATTTPIYPTGHPANNFLESLQINLPVDLWSGGFSIGGARLTVATAAGQSTQNGYEVAPSTNPPRWEHGEPTSTLFSDGDGTVPQDSSEFMFGPDKTFYDNDHNSVASSSAGYIFEAFNSRAPDTIVGKIYNPVTSFLYLQLFSPIDMQVVAPDGKRLGKNFANNTEWSEIPDAFYSGFNSDNEYAIIPNPLPGEYKVETVGTGGGGEYTIVSSYSNLATTTQTELTGATTPGEVIDHTLALSPTTTTVIITIDTPPQEVTPKKCVQDVETAYLNHWITKKSVYTRLLADCRLLGKLFKTRDSMGQSPDKNKKPSDKSLRGINTSIKATLDRMEKLINHKSNTQEAVDLLNQDITWFRENELH
ncbi:hypothetical protein HYS79_01840 [Patescibacteria group bacterium]|nr:hypothetical protein [Patescibacteria group bacterium]